MARHTQSKRDEISSSKDSSNRSISHNKSINEDKYETIEEY